MPDEITNLKIQLKNFQPLLVKIRDHETSLSSLRAENEYFKKLKARCAEYELLIQELQTKLQNDHVDPKEVEKLQIKTKQLESQLKIQSESKNTEIIEELERVYRQKIKTLQNELSTTKSALVEGQQSQSHISFSNPAGSSTPELRKRVAAEVRKEIETEFEGKRKQYETSIRQAQEEARMALSVVDAKSGSNSELTNMRNLVKYLQKELEEKTEALKRFAMDNVRLKESGRKSEKSKIIIDGSFMSQDSEEFMKDIPKPNKSHFDISSLARLDTEDKELLSMFQLANTSRAERNSKLEQTRLTKTNNDSSLHKSGVQTRFSSSSPPKSQTQPEFYSPWPKKPTTSPAKSLMEKYY